MDKGPRVTDSAERVAAALEADAEAHERGEFEIIRRRFDKVWSEIPGIAQLPSQLVSLTLWFWDDWGDASSHDWLGHEPMRKDDWPRLARIIANHVRDGSMPGDDLIPETFRRKHTQRFHGTELEWCNALDEALNQLGEFFSRADDTIDWLVFVEPQYAERVHPELSPLWQGSRFGSKNSAGLYRLNRGAALEDAIGDTAGYGFFSLIGVPPDMASTLHMAAEKGAMRVVLNGDSCLVGILDNDTPWFEFAAIFEVCVYRAGYSPSCPDDIRRILDDAMLRRPKLRFDYRTPGRGLLRRIARWMFRS